MPTKINPAKSAGSNTSTSPSFSAIFDFDRITVWLDRPELPISPTILEEHCTRLEVHLEQMPYQARWKLRLDIFQPTRTCLKRLASALGNEVSTLINYVEIACDLPSNGKPHARNWRDQFLAAALMRSQRQLVVRYKTCWYYGRRTNGEQNRLCAQSRSSQRRSNVLALYAHRPSKLGNARPSQSLPPCLHIEWRATGSASVAALGIVSLGDLIQFDHHAFWDRHVRMFEVPAKPTALGRLLAKAAGADVDVSGTALRRRAARWMAKHSVDGKFVMHNALRATPKLVPMLNSMPFSVWLEQITASVPAD